MRAASHSKRDHVLVLTGMWARERGLGFQNMGIKDNKTKPTGTKVIDQAVACGQM